MHFLEERCEKLGWKSGQISWRRHCEWELQGSGEAREKIANIDNGAHAGRGVVNQSRRFCRHSTLPWGLRNSKYAEGLLWARQLLRVKQWAPLHFSPHQPLTSYWLLSLGPQRGPCRPLPVSVCLPDWAPPFTSETQLGARKMLQEENHKLQADPGWFPSQAPLRPIIRWCNDHGEPTSLNTAQFPQKWAWPPRIA